MKTENITTAYDGLIWNYLLIYSYVYLALFFMGYESKTGLRMAVAIAGAELNVFQSFTILI